MKKFNKIEKDIVSLCRCESEIMAVYVFGSCAKGTNKKKSDIDIAVLLKDYDPNGFSVLSFLSGLEKKIGSKIDIIVLNRASEVLKFEVRCHGKLVFERSEAFRKRFEITGRKTYEDFLYLHNRYINSVLYGKKNGQSSSA
jgi:hypothetical protein